MMPVLADQRTDHQRRFIVMEIVEGPEDLCVSSILWDVGMGINVRKNMISATIHRGDFYSGRMVRHVTLLSQTSHGHGIDLQSFVLKAIPPPGHAFDFVQSPK